MSYDQSIDSEIRQRLIDLEQRFLTALEGGLPCLIVYQHSWTVFEAEIVSFGHNVLSVDTQKMVGALSNNIEAVLSNLVDLQRTAERLHDRLNADLAEILDDMGHVDHATDTIDSSQDSETLDIPRYSCPPYIASAYKWLRNNLHKPYPTIEELRSICADSNTTEKRIKSWFTSARQRMGWTKIARDHFRRDREDTADAAYRALIEPDPRRPIDPTLMLKFVKMQVAAERMYSATFKPTQFVGRLATAVVGMSAEHQACLEQMRHQAIDEENMRVEAEHLMKKQRLAQRKGSQRRSVSLYPSPEPSTGGSPEPIHMLSETEEGETDTPPPNSAAGRKRRRSSTLDEDIPAHKRSRNDLTPPPEEPSITLPSSPASDEENATDVFDHWSSPEDALTEPEPSMTPPPAKRKRRLSDSDLQGPRKRPGGLAPGPRLRPVSDPLPKPSAILPDWNFDHNMLDFEIPPAVTLDQFDPSMPVEVEYINWASDMFPVANTPYSSTASSSPMSIGDIDLPTSSSPISPVPEFDMSGLADSDFDRFLLNITMFPQSTQLQVTEPAPAFENAAIPQAMPMLPQIMPPTVNVVGDNWHQMTMYLASHGQEFDLSIHPNLDPSLSKLPRTPSPAEIIAQSEEAAKQVKREQLRAHLEAAKKLEQELTSA